VAVKGTKSYGDVKIGYDFQGVLAPNKAVDSSIATGGQQSLFGDMRDAFVSVGHKSIGTFQFGQMDTIYEDTVTGVRMLDVSSSNFTSTSGVLSGVGWKGATGAGTTSFNTRIGSQVRWESPLLQQLQHRPHGS
jgi:predicted porin